ncbi:hypothetical protein ACJ41O_003320 [Fusarium nematophilum]
MLQKRDPSKRPRKFKIRSKAGVPYSDRARAIVDVGLEDIDDAVMAWIPDAVSDYITHLDERSRLVRLMLKASILPALVFRMDATVFAILMVAPIENLKSMFPSHAHQDGEFTTRDLVNTGLYDLLRDDPADIPADSSELIGLPSKEIGEQCKKRDQNRCVCLSSADSLPVTIFPYASIYASAGRILHSFLMHFWPDKFQAWFDQVRFEDILDSPKNCICMDRELHRLWRMAAFALKPLQQRESEIVVQFHWLKKPKLRPGSIMGENFLKQSGLTDQEWGNGELSPMGRRKIKTGETFVIRAEDPDELPSFELLELQWYVLRIAAISGVAVGSWIDHFYAPTAIEDEGFQIVYL